MPRQDPTQTLIEKARRGDRDAFDGLTKANYDRVRALVIHRLDGAPGAPSVDDVLQESFLRAYGQLERFEWQGEDSLA